MSDPIGEITNVEDLMQVLASFGGPETQWYRGHSDISWQLIPSLARKREWIESEILMLKKFKQNAIPRLVGPPAGEWDWLFLAQHHGLPTRLLDWSENPLIGLYFASESDEDADGRFWILRPNDLNEKSSPGSPGILLFGQDDLLDTYLPEEAKSPRPTQPPVAAVAARSFGRIVAQSGTFTICHRSFEPLEGVHAGTCLASYSVPLARKAFIREQLKTLGINAMTVYPDLSHLAEYVRSEF
ncbi:FRG domain-containing protein [Streptomyces buecherae]|uniref:FRG domain-containing protein n=1 Tax=Streptomyces buecherae TaxID=2763006 RepID=UPI001C26EF42|nr:FRG domain-containing protein [Streptomyces buecherae]